MDTIIKKIKSLPSLRSKKSSEAVIQSYLTFDSRSGPVERLYVPAVLNVRYPDRQWTNLGKCFKTSTIRNLQQQQKTVEVLENLVDVMLGEATMD